jgi:acyl-CoA thioesterase-1
MNDPRPGVGIARSGRGPSVGTSPYRYLRRIFNRFALALAITFAWNNGGTMAADRDAVVAFLGDSLTAGYGLASEQAFPARLERALRRAGARVKIVNAGVSGDTTAGGLARLDWVLGDKPDVVVVELGANDALRGLDPRAAESNLDAILSRIRERGVRSALVGMRAPRSLGRDYAAEFDGMYARLAAKHSVPLYDFFLDGVALRPDLNQSDLIHPNAAGVDVIVERILPFMQRVLADLAPRVR